MANRYSQDSCHDIEADATTPLLLPATSTNDTKTYHDLIDKALTPTAGTCCGHTCCHAHIHNIERNLIKPSYLYTQYHNPTDWLLMFEEVARANNWSSRAKLDILPIYLQEGYQPRTWFRQNLYQWESIASGGSADAEEAGFDVLRQAFLKEFGEGGERWKVATSWTSMACIALVFLLVVSCMMFAIAI
ncbi:hypothetical protein BGZ90_006711 [Linnemannia elongata]|nr:hypothetical protein BGZ90_006711 [Linnemannia elongata]